MSNAGSAHLRTRQSNSSLPHQQPRHRGGWGHHPYSRGSGWHGGGAVAAGVIGGLVLGGIAAAAASPPSAYPYGYPSYPYGYGYNPYYRQNGVYFGGSNFGVRIGF